jgi:hypothetical protein
VDWWSRDLKVIHFSSLGRSAFIWPIQLSATSPDAAFELVDVLVANAQNAVHMICESIAARLFGGSERNKKQPLNPNL